MTASFVETLVTPEQDFIKAGLRNDRVEVVVLPELGAKVLSLRNLRSGREWMWAPPEGARFRKLPLGTPFEESSLTGADECLPTIGETEWRGRSIPSHGEVWSAAWELDRLALTNSQIVTRVRLPLSPFWFERTIRLDDNVVSFDYALRNLDFLPQEFMWAFHPLMNIHEGDRLELLGVEEVRCEAAVNVALGGRGDAVAWPKPLPDVDLSYLDLGGTAAVKLFTKPHEASGAILRNDRTGDTLRLDFNPRQVDTIGIWLTRGAWNGYHHLAVEPGIGAPDPLDVAVEQWKQFGLVLPDGTYRWRFTLTVS